MVDLGHGELAIEAVLAGFQGACHFEAEEIEGEAVADDAAALELGGDGLGAGTGGDVDEGLGGGAVR